MRTVKSENPGALAGASGANSKTVGLPSYTSRSPVSATVESLRAAHLVRCLGVSEHAAAMLAALAFAGGAS